MHRSPFIFVVTALAMLAASAALGQTPPDATKVDKSKPQEAAAAPAAPVLEFTQEAQATVGLLFNDGNTSAAAGRADAYYQMKYLVHGIRVDVTGGLTSVAQDPDEDAANGFGLPLFDSKNKANTTAGVRLRYDFFLTPDDSIYASGFVFHDSAANLLLRLRADVGYRHFFFNVPKHMLSGEVGIVYTIDDAPVGTDDNRDGIVDIADHTKLEDTGTFGGRVALAYTNALSDSISYTTTLEVIPNLFPDVAAPFESARFGAGDNKLGFGEATVAAWTNTLTVNVNKSLGIGVNLTVLYDNGAIARRNTYANHDIAASFQLTYKLF